MWVSYGVRYCHVLQDGGQALAFMELLSRILLFLALIEKKKPRLVQRFILYLALNKMSESKA